MTEINQQEYINTQQQSRSVVINLPLFGKRTATFSHEWIDLRENAKQWNVAHLICLVLRIH